MTDMSSTARPLGVAILGAGAIAESAHIPAWRKRTDAVVRAVVDRDDQRAERTAARFNIASWSTDHRTLLDRGDIDAVDICLPAALHAETAIAFLSVGKHVLLEKPFAVSVSEAQRVIAADRASGAVLMVAENWPFGTAVRRAHQILASARLGNLTMLRARHESSLYLYDKLPVGMRAAASGGGITLSAGIHLLNIAASLMGDFDALTAYSTARPSSPEPFIDREVVIAARFANGGIGAFNITGRSRHLGERRLELAVFGEGGVLEFDICSGRVISDIDGVRTTYDELPSMGYEEEIDHFVECVTKGTPPLTSSEDQLHTLTCALAVYRSLFDGREVRPAELLTETEGRGGSS